MEQGTHHAAALSTITGHNICPDRATEQEEEKEVVFSHACVCVFACSYVSAFVWAYVRRWQSCQV